MCMHRRRFRYTIRPKPVRMRLSSRARRKLRIRKPTERSQPGAKADRLRLNSNIRPRHRSANPHRNSASQPRNSASRPRRSVRLHHNNTSQPRNSVRLRRSSVRLLHNSMRPLRNSILLRNIRGVNFQLFPNRFGARRQAGVQSEISEQFSDCTADGLPL